MPRMRYLETFLDDAETIHTPRLRSQLQRVLLMIETFPQSGRTSDCRSIVNRYGAQDRTCAVGPFCVVYTYDEKADLVVLYGLVPQRSPV